MIWSEIKLSKRFKRNDLYEKTAPGVEMYSVSKEKLEQWSKNVENYKNLHGTLPSVSYALRYLLPK